MKKHFYVLSIVLSITLGFISSRFEQNVLTPIIVTIVLEIIMLQISIINKNSDDSKVVALRAT